MAKCEIPWDAYEVWMSDLDILKRQQLAFPETPRDKFSADYRLEKKPDGWVATDILIEDVSLADNFRSQFDKALSKGSWDDLITRLKNKLEKKSDGALD
jgi:ABC-type transporter MlaC component